MLSPCRAFDLSFFLRLLSPSSSFFFGVPAAPDATSPPWAASLPACVACFLGFCSSLSDSPVTSRFPSPSPPFFFSPSWAWVGLSLAFFRLGFFALVGLSRGQGGWGCDAPGMSPVRDEPLASVPIHWEKDDGDLQPSQRRGLSAISLQVVVAVSPPQTMSFQLPIAPWVYGAAPPPYYHDSSNCPIPCETLRYWRELAFAAARAMASYVLCRAGRKPIYKPMNVGAWEEADPTMHFMPEWAEELRVRGRELVQAVDGDGEGEKCEADTFFTAVLEAWRASQGPDLSSCPVLGEVCEFMATLLEANHLLSCAHRKLSQHRLCSYQFPPMGTLDVIPTITSFVRRVTANATHVCASLHHLPTSVVYQPDWPPPSNLHLWEGYYAKDPQGQAHLADSAPPPSRPLPRGGPCGMYFSPPGTLQPPNPAAAQEQVTPQPTSQRPPSRPSSRRVSGLSSRARREEASMASVDLFGSQQHDESDRMSRLEAELLNTKEELSRMSAMMSQLLTMAQGMRGGPVREASEEAKQAPPQERDEARDDTEVPTDPREVEESSALLKLRQDRRKERSQVLRTVVPWCKGLHAWHDRTSVLRPLLHRRYGPPIFTSIGDVAALDDGVKMYRSFAYGPEAVGIPREEGATGSASFHFTSAAALALLHFRIGGPMRDDEPFYFRTMDFLPLGDGDARARPFSPPEQGVGPSLAPPSFSHGGACACINWSTPLTDLSA